MKNLKIAFVALAIATSFAACKGKEEAVVDSPAVDTTVVDTTAADTTADTAAKDTTTKM
nr:hypothetical protein [uncultured Mucilaginibacter sp.]